jgi:hypothetical protein
MKVFVAAISHRHGTNLYAAFTQEALTAQIVEYCQEWWETEWPDKEMPGDEDIIAEYFSDGNDEGCEEAEIEVGEPAALKP